MAFYTRYRSYINFNNKIKENNMAKGKTHYLPNGKVYTGSTHKTDGKLMSGAKHTTTSKLLSHTKKK